MASLPTKARIILVDDHQLIRDSLRLLLRDQADLELAANAYDTETGWHAIEDLRPNLVLMDLSVPEEGGVALTARIRRKFPQTKVLVLTGHAESRHVHAALEAGANGYVLKANGFSVLLEAIRTVLAGKTFLCPDTSAIVVKQMQHRADTGADRFALSAREIEVLRHIADGRSTKEVAFDLGVSTKTIETHRHNLMTKLKVTSIAELTKYAVREGLTKL